MNAQKLSLIELFNENCSHSFLFTNFNFSSNRLGWKGLNCTELDCGSCLNGGICQGVVNASTNQTSPQCLCTENFYGKNCELKGKKKHFLCCFNKFDSQFVSIFKVIDPCLSSPCRTDEDCIREKETFNCLINLCKKLRPCNNNSECVFSKENSTFDCQCLNGESNCDVKPQNSIKITEVEVFDNQIISSYVLHNETDPGSANETKLFLDDYRNFTHTEIPMVGFNLENVTYLFHNFIINTI